MKYNRIVFMMMALFVYTACNDDAVPGTKEAKFKLGFKKMTKVYVKKGSFKASELISNMSGAKKGCQIEEVRNIKPAGILKVTGTAPDVMVHFLGTGTVTMDVVVQNPKKVKYTIKGAVVEIVTLDKDLVKGKDMVAIFQSFKYVKNPKITSQEILKFWKEKKDGYQLKAVKYLNPTDVVAVQGKAPSLYLKVKKSGTFTATYIFSNGKDKDIAVKGKFIILPYGGFKFGGISKLYQDDGSFSSAEILKFVIGLKDGYKIKEIRDLSQNDVASVQKPQGQQPYLKFKKVGSFTATLVLKHASKKDIVIENAAFAILAQKAPVLTFKTLTKKYVDGGQFTNAEILNNVQGLKDGYTIKNINHFYPAGLVESVVKDEKIALNFKKVGKFTASITLVHDSKLPVYISRAIFDIKKGDDQQQQDQQAVTDTWSKDYKTGALKSITQGSDGGYVVLSDSKGAADIEVVKVDENGKVVWKKAFEAGHKKAYKIITAKDGGYVFTGGVGTIGSGWDFWIVKLNKDGNVVWNKTYSKAGLKDIGYSVSQTSNGNYIAVGNNHAIAVDGNGDQQWVKTLNTKVKLKANHATNDGGVIVTGHQVAGMTKRYGYYGYGKYKYAGKKYRKKGYTHSGGYVKNYVAKLDSNGNVVWEKSYDDLKHSVNTLTSDGGSGFVLVGHTWDMTDASLKVLVLKIDGNGNKVWSNAVGNLSRYVSSNSIVKTRDGYVIATQSSASGKWGWGANISGGILKIDNSGNKVWSKVYQSDDKHSLFNGIVNRNDGRGYVMAGLFMNNYWQKYGWIMKVKSDGTL